MQQGAQGSRLASLRPLSGDDEMLFEATLDTEATRIFVTNVGGAATDMRLHHVADGDNPDQENALFYDYSIDTGQTLQVFADALNSGIQMKEGESLWVRSGVGGNLTFNVYGVTASIAPGANT